MKALNIAALLAITALVVVGLGACGPKSSGSSSASTAATACTWNGSAYVFTGTSNICSPSASACIWNGSQYVISGTSNTCTPATAGCTLIGSQFVDQFGQACTPGTTTGTTSVPQANTCDYWSQYYGVQYVPVNVSGQLICVQYAYLNGYTLGTPYYSNYNFYYSQIISSGFSCSTEVTVDLGPGFGPVNLCL